MSSEAFFETIFLVSLMPVVSEHEHEHEHEHESGHSRCHMYDS